MRPISMSAVGVLAALAVAVACGGPQAEPAPPPPPEPDLTAEPPPAPEPTATAEEPPPEPEKLVWEKMNHEQQVEHMKTVVVPKMTAVFQEFDGKRYKEMGCTTCHGEGAKEGKFDMPNPKLPKLDPKDGFAKHMKKSPKVTKFMMEKVVPEMAPLLDEQPYNPETQEGFGCAGCHTMVEAPVAKK